MANTGSTRSPFKHFHVGKPKTIGLFLELGRIGFVAKQEKFKKQITDKTSKAIIVVYSNNHTRETYKL